MCKKLVFLSVCILMAGPLFAAPDGLVAYWPFDEGSGATAFDASGNGNDGILNGDPTWVTGQIGGALDFSGSNSFVAAPHIPIESRTFTIAMWINATTVAADQVVFGQHESGSTNLSLHYRITAAGAVRMGFYSNDLDSPGGTIQAGVWSHITFVYDFETQDRRIYLNGVQIAQASNVSPYLGTAGDTRIGQWNNNQYFDGMIDDVQVYYNALTEADALSIMDGLGDPGMASSPQPATEATDVVREVELAWNAGETTVKRNVYLGTSWQDVNDASPSVLVGQNLTDTSLDVGTLDFDQTYYWRVDEANGAPDNTVFTGEVWSFTVEPKGVPVTNITATASGGNEGMGPEKTIDGSGLNDMDQHSSLPNDMWLTDLDGAWIQYDFDNVYKLHELLVWNSNQAIEAFIGFGIKEMTVEYTADGENWMALDGVVELTRASGQPIYDTPDVIDMGGVMAQGVKLTVGSALGFTPNVGLSEVRILAIPVMPREPQPADGGISDGIEVALSWRAGREAVSHEVSLGADADSLVSIDTSTETTTLTDLLDYDTSYAWSVTEVNDATVPTSHTGNVWTFTTPEFGTVEDFESYSGDEGQEVFMTWFDGFGGDASLGGSTTGHIDGPFVETAIVNSGSQSLPVYIDNDGGFFDIDGKSSSPTFSEVVRDLSPAQDWTASGVKTLSIMFAGSAGLTGQLYCKIGSSKIVYDGDAASIGSSAWQAWNIDLSTVGGNLKSVKELAIGVDGGTSGILYLDDIRLYTQIGELITPAEPAADGLVAHYTFENNANDVSGNGHNGTLNGGALFATGKIGSALDCDGIDGYVSTDKSAAQLGIDGNNARTVSSWVYTRAYNNGGIYDVGARTATQDFCLRTMATENEWRIQYWGGDSDFNYDTLNKWVHFTHTHDGERTKVYADGMLIVDWEKTIDTSNDNPFQIGCYGWQVDFFSGMIDEVRVYNRALTAEEALWLAGKTQPVHKPF